MSDDKFGWVDFYSEFADKLLGYRKDRKSLVDKIIGMYNSLGMTLPTLEKEGRMPADVDPFTIFALFNKGLPDHKRHLVCNGLAKCFDISAAIPSNFAGIPVVSSLKAAFYSFNHMPNDINNLWELFEVALLFANAPDDVTLMNEFITSYDIVSKQKVIKWNITMGLYWCRPYSYVSLDSVSRDFLCNVQYLPANYLYGISGVHLKKNTPPSGDQYIRIIVAMKDEFVKAHGISKYHSFPELSLAAWQASRNNKHSTELDDMAPQQDIKKINQDGVWDAKDCIAELNSAILADDVSANGPAEPQYPAYDETDFLRDVFMDEAQYRRIVSTLRRKKNIILQGPPGTGKTFAAKRLAYSMLGVKDASRVSLIQFHQSYSYEDFIMGYRPSADGFELRTGAFYDFCLKARDDDERGYFFIIDEINRGNLGKIFGELFMLIERDKRDAPLRLLYRDELFSVPENLYIIGLMNTADRSLAMMDYALRRRFAFITFAPAFGTESFNSYLASKGSRKLEKLAASVARLNDAIAEDASLGEGFRIGHSYLCTGGGVTEEWLRDVVELELIPLLAEYWYDEPSKAAEWAAVLKEALK